MFCDESKFDCFEDRSCNFFYDDIKDNVSTIVNFAITGDKIGISEDDV